MGYVDGDRKVNWYSTEKEAISACAEFNVSRQAGNSPAIIHQHYRLLATEAEAEAYFAIRA